MSTLENPPAFPQPLSLGDHGHFSGMTLRDYFAAKAMQGILACPEDADWDADITAQNAYEQADAMLAARNRAGEEGRS